MQSFVAVYFKSSIRKNPNTNQYDGYYRLIESYRNMEGRVCHRTILNVGFLENNITAEQLNKTQAHINERCQKQETLFSETDAQVIALTESLWMRLLQEKRIDIEKTARQVDVDTIKHSNVREIGSEWMCYQSWNQLQLSEFLVSQGFSENQAQLAATQVISRAVYPASELKTTSWIQQNSGVCELTGYKIENLTKDKLYQSALALQQIAPALQSHLSQRTNSLFNLEDKIILYDLTNTYFEGSMRQSELAQYGRSKEKRNDAKLIVLAMVVNVEGFIKHTALHQGNIADCNTLKDTIKKIDSSLGIEKPIVVLDAGIATEENLTMLQTQGYKYVCVSRNKLKNYEAVSSKLPIILTTKGKQKIQIKAVHNASNTDYYFEVNSPKKAIKEIGMKNAFEKRFEEELQKIKHALGKKSGVKQIDKVNQRIGRAKQKYPSVQYYYNLELHNDIEKNIVLDITWSKNEELHKQKTETLGVYFLRTNMNLKEEKVVWDIYNTIREIESTFRTLKTDLDLRPIYHKSDAGAMAHLHLGIMAYWLVNTIRFQLKEKGIHSSWTEIVRIGNTQKMITTSGQNTYNKIISVRKCSEPNENLKQIYAAIRIKTKPFKKIKSVVHKTTAKKIETPNYKPPQRL